MSVLRCYDSVTHEAIPDAPLVLGYVDGQYRTWAPLNERFKDTSTVVLSVTVDVKQGADIADCERGNASPAAVASWARFELKARRRPTIYGSVDWLRQCAKDLRAQRINPSLVDWFLADYVQVAPSFDGLKFPSEIPNGYIAWQFADSIPVPGGHSIDASVVDLAYATRHGYNRRKVASKPAVKVVPLVTATNTTAQSNTQRFLEAGYYLNAENAVKVG